MAEGKYIKVKLDLHPAKRWEKPKWVTDKDIDDIDRMLYNDLKDEFDEMITEGMDIQDFSWIDKLLVEDEQYSPLEEPYENYAISTYGRIFSGKRKQSVVTSSTGKRFYVMLLGASVNMNKEFAKRGWIFVPSFIREKHKQYGWRVYTSKLFKKNNKE